MIHPSPATPLAHDPSNHDKALSAATRIQARYRGKKTRGMPITVLAARARAREDAEAGTSIMGTLKVMGISALKLIVYLVLGAVVYGFGEPTFGQDVSTTVIDSIYFSVATMSTVGYGDLSPTTTSMRVFTLFMIYGGIIFVFADISGKSVLSSWSCCNTRQQILVSSVCFSKPHMLYQHGSGHCFSHSFVHEILSYVRRAV